MALQETVNEIVDTCKGITESLERMVDGERKFAEDLKAMNEEFKEKEKQSNRLFKKKTYEIAEQVIFECIDDRLTPQMLKDIIHDQLKYLHDTYFGC